MKTEPTPRPWGWEESGGDPVRLSGANGKTVIGSTNDKYHDDYLEVSAADQEYILRAANLHDELVAACKAARSKLEKLHEEHCHAGVMLDDVLAKLESKP